MIANREIDRIVETTARETLRKNSVVRTFHESTVDSEGNDALRIVIVLSPESVDRQTGEKVLNALTRIHDRLFEAGEERLPIVEYATEDELTGANDS